MPIVMLIDNGSARAAATLKLRELASQLSQRINQQVYPVSLQHADKVAAKELNGQPASVFTKFLAEQLKQGEREFTAIPLFFGKSRALTSFIPEQINSLKSEHGEFEFDLKDEVYPLDQGEPLLAEAIYEHIQQCVDQLDGTDRIVLVDHGSPEPKITEVRQRVAKEIESSSGVRIDQAVMERREGSEYDFNGQLLADYLTEQIAQGARKIIVAQMFFLPGRHAGEGGDIQEICQLSQSKDECVNIAASVLVSENVKLIDILVNRVSS